MDRVEIEREERKMCQLDAIRSWGCHAETVFNEYVGYTELKKNSQAFLSKNKKILHKTKPRL